MVVDTGLTERTSQGGVLVMKDTHKSRSIPKPFCSARKGARRLNGHIESDGRNQIKMFEAIGDPPAENTA